MPMIKEKLFKTCQVLQKYTDSVLEKIQGLEMVESGYKVGHTPPAEGWKPLGLIHGAHKHFWIRGSFRTPKADSKQLIKDISKYVEPVRPGRRDTRNIKAKSFVGFVYRVSA